ncbi:hypothetical protein XNC1_2941 [Xenorhabdus nematophila ATCC 19061]|uniref:Uncharacterized protein n=1 Tax=Xenorhabdus nematophila (strain ATCC 19061 / DSM 3370 / CCUG 14189 / LMG 1036 / NCIMB 9965 / AN6) TaxID=406817 RepID=D3VJT6_XENNA|nr:hypothetical protein XNC1_2941 [Xenorhabdus nematophila ATCC 19061]CEK23817.1 hypothetical protein XNC2_2823 [Xenorhabdus nematophila AN6/1]
MVAVHHQPYSRLAIKQGTRAASLETQPYQHLIVNTVQMSRLLLSRMRNTPNLPPGQSHLKFIDKD